MSQVNHDLFAPKPQPKPPCHEDYWLAASKACAKRCGESHEKVEQRMAIYLQSTILPRAPVDGSRVFENVKSLPRDAKILEGKLF